MKFTEWVAQFPDDDAYDVAKRAVIDEPDMVIPLVAERVMNARRAPVREIEQRTMRRLLEVMRSTHPVVATTGEAKQGFRAAFLDERIAVDFSGRQVTWGAATVEELEARAEMLSTQIKGIQLTRNLLRASIKRIRDAGVSCLNDIAEQFNDLEDVA